MTTKAGEKIRFDDLGLEVIVTAAGDADITATAGDDDLQIGKRYQDEATGTQVLIVKPGAATLWCGDNSMTMMEPKKVTASD